MKTKELNKTMTRRAMKVRRMRKEKKTKTTKEKKKKWKKKKRQQQNDELLFLHVYLKYIMN